MPTILTHAAVPLAIGLGLGKRIISRRLLVAGVAVSMLPDVDTLGMQRGIPYGSQFGHRGMTHSLIFAVLIGLFVAVAHRQLRSSRAITFSFVFFAAASHGILDAFTTGGKGVEFLWPFSRVRYFAPWRVIRVSPIGIDRFVHHGAMQVVQSEVLWVWLPMALLFLMIVAFRRQQSRSYDG